MEDFKDFKLTSVSGKIPLKKIVDTDPLDMLIGTWKGTGFNQIWRPANKNTNGPGTASPPQDRFLELNETLEQLVFKEVSKEVPNRGLFAQADINLHGIDYLQQIKDAHVKDPSTGKLSGIHFEPGMWLLVPPTDADPVVNVPTVARMASIPHGTTLVAQGTFTTIPGPPVIHATNILPFPIGSPGAPFNFPEQNLSIPTPFRTPAADIPGVTQAMVNDPNSVLQAGLAGKDIISTTILQVSTNLPAPPPPTGGGTSNISFLTGAPPTGPNAFSVQVDATFWIETIKDKHGKIHHQLQYTQLVLLNFATLSWPHVSVATLEKI
jgi:hypothetical protein